MAEVAALERLPEEVFDAALGGDIATIKTWLDQGGHPDQGLHGIHGPEGRTYGPGTTLLMAAASESHLDVVRLLVDRGADVNVRTAAGYQTGWSALIFAVIVSCSADCVKYLLARGADTNGMVDGTRIIFTDITEILDQPRLVRMLLAAGLVLTTARFGFSSANFDTFEELARVCARDCLTNSAECSITGQIAYDDQIQDLINEGNRYTEVAYILEGTRLAGHSYKRWVLKDYMTLLRVRSLLARGRATMAPSTPEVIVRLFGGRIAAARRPPTRRTRPLERAEGVPDPVFWKVMEYYRLGDWRRP